MTTAVFRTPSCQGNTHLNSFPTVSVQWVEFTLQLSNWTTNFYIPDLYSTHNLVYAAQKKRNRFSETRGSPSAAVLGMHPQLWSFLLSSNCPSTRISSNTPPRSMSFQNCLSYLLWPQINDQWNHQSYRNAIMHHNSAVSWVGVFICRAS